MTPLSVLADLQKPVETSLLDGLEEVACHDAAEFTPHLLASAVHETYKLSDGKDCCYDGPGIGFAYASWYHPRRVNQLIGGLLPLVPVMPKRLVILDLGAGTGALAWALGLTVLAAKRAGMAAPESLEVLAVDSSPSMLATSEVLWHHLTANVPGLCELASTRRVARPWVDPPDLPHDGWVFAGHLFDVSEAAGEIKERFGALLNRLRPQRVLIDAPKMKTWQLHAAIEAALEVGLETKPMPRREGTPWTSTFNALGELRRRHLGSLGLPLAMLAKTPSWVNTPETLSAHLVATGYAGDRLIPSGPMGLALDAEQEALCRPSERFEVLIGAPGSGKSVVLVERLARTVEQRKRADGPARVLVTSHNLDMVDRLFEWFVGRMGDATPDVESDARGNYTVRVGSRGHRSTVWFLNRDKIPTRIFRMSVSGTKDVAAIQARLNKVASGRRGQISGSADYLSSPHWLAAELSRVIHSQRLSTLKAYLDADREGRRVPLLAPGREAVWNLLMETSGPMSFTYKWIELTSRFKEELDGGDLVDLEYVDPFTHIFVDEVQDFPRAEIELLASMMQDTRGLFATGDGGQAMLMAGCFDVPGTLRKRRRSNRILNHSYRLSRRIAEAVQPLAQQLYDEASQSRQRWIGVPKGTRSGVLGLRPVVLLKGDDVTEQVRCVLTHHQRVLPPGSMVTLAEEPWASDLSQAARAFLAESVSVASESVASIKGLERTCVIWDTSREWALDESAIQFAHTVLTRATTLIILILDPIATSLGVKAALALLDPDRLLFWSDQAREAWSGLK